ncbi:MAG: hypothetical protein MUO21_00650, partial [Nitrososphaeraceae archaeon]|nr:hypothetical protein [Nitrososphaeraceae archaeon]
EKGSSENHQVNNLKVVIDFAKFLGPNIIFYNISKKEQITSFLNTKIKSYDIDPDKRWITTWNHFLNRIKLFMHNAYTKKVIYQFDRYIKRGREREYICKVSYIFDNYNNNYIRN